MPPRKEAVDRARAGGGPTLIEAVTFRFHGHVFGDADAYMDKGEKEAAMARDPVPAFRAWLIANGHASEARARRHRGGHRAGDRCGGASSPSPAPIPTSAELRRDVFADEVSA